MWVALVDLPPILRSKYENIVLCSVWYGSGDLPWDDIFKSYQQEISRKFTVNAEDYVFDAKFKTIALIVDLPGKSSVLKMKKFNGYYGCTLCEMRGQA